MSCACAQAALRAATRTEIWQRSRRNVNALTLLDMNEMVGAALVGFDRREAVTLPPLPDVKLWEPFDTLPFLQMPLHRFPSNHPGREEPRFKDADGNAWRVQEISRRGSPAESEARAGSETTTGPPAPPPGHGGGGGDKSLCRKRMIEQANGGASPSVQKRGFT